MHPAVWLVHRPHGDTAVRKTVTRQASDVHKLGAELPRHALYTKACVDALPRLVTHPGTADATNRVKHACVCVCLRGR